MEPQIELTPKYINKTVTFSIAHISETPRHTTSAKLKSYVNLLKAFYLKS